MRSSLRVSAYTDADWGGCQTSHKSTMSFWDQLCLSSLLSCSGYTNYFGPMKYLCNPPWSIKTVSLLCNWQAMQHPISDLNTLISIVISFVSMFKQTIFIKLVFVASHDQLADPLTKGLPKPSFVSLISKLGLKIFISQLKGKYYKLVKSC